MEGKQGAAPWRKRGLGLSRDPPTDRPTNCPVLGLVSASLGAMVRVQWGGEPGSPGFRHLGCGGGLYTEEVT